MRSEQQNKNLTLGLILGSVVLVFFVGFIVRLTFFGTPKRPQMAPISSIALPAQPASPAPAVGNTAAPAVGHTAAPAVGHTAAPAVGHTKP